MGNVTSVTASDLRKKLLVIIRALVSREIDTCVVTKNGRNILNISLAPDYQPPAPKTSKKKESSGNEEESNDELIERISGSVG